MQKGIWKFADDAKLMQAVYKLMKINWKELTRISEIQKREYKPLLLQLLRGTSKKKSQQYLD